jgi:aspartyl-tRNA(Asn)/glutamyl-tRNA(Gln) amidotransferase subunit A
VRAGTLRAADVVAASQSAPPKSARGREWLNAVVWCDDAARPATPRRPLDARERGTRRCRLAGVPRSPSKDNIATLGLPTTCGSRILDGYVSPFEATVVARLRAAGAVVVGKTNMDEFGMGSSTEHSTYGRPATRSTRRASPAGRPAVRPRRWRPASSRSRSGRRPAAP